ncbi:MAG: hypothetical protein ABJY83_07415 [Roseibium sp.]
MDIIDNSASIDPAQSISPLSLGGFREVITVATGAVILAGVVREIFVFNVGTETVLQDLRHFALDAERNLGAWYSSLLLMLSAFLLYFCGGLSRARRLRGSYNWYLLAVIFVFLSVDETVGFHETLIDPLRSAFDAKGIFHFAWVIPGMLAVFVAGLYFIPFLLRLPRRLALGMFVAGLVYVGGALGLELVGGLIASDHGMQATNYIMVAIVEESLEMIGLTIFLWVLSGHICDHNRLYKIVR